ncbi:MAG: SDR family oxidoreductase [Protaetiibacter sp.]
MKVFVTGASGWIGQAASAELVRRGHEVLGLARSEEGATRVVATGARVLRGDLDELDTLREGARGVDAVIHLANKHDFGDPAASNRAERAAVQTFVDELAGSGRPFLFASGLAGAQPGVPLTEHDASPHIGPDSMRGGAEHLALGSADRGLVPVALRFAPTVHGAGDHGFVSVIAGVARRRGVSGYPGEGENRWAAVHRDDLARLIALVLADPGRADGVVHGVAEQGVPTREIAEAIGRVLGLPVATVEADRVLDHFGWIGRFFGADLQASARLTRERYGWEPIEPGLIADIEAGAYGTE